MELCRKPVVVVTTSNFLGSACKLKATALSTARTKSFFMIVGN
jgi:hypothetical protein